MGGVLKEMFVEYRLKNIKLKGVFIMEKVKKQFVYFLALVLVWSTFNIAFNHLKKAIMYYQSASLNNEFEQDKVKVR